jgi:hypothetical protein
MLLEHDESRTNMGGSDISDLGSDMSDLDNLPRF